MPRGVYHLNQPRQALLRYACHEGNYEVMRGMLAAARLSTNGRVK